MCLKNTFFALLIIILLASITISSYSVEIAPRISDREIIESLAELKAGQKTLEKQVDQRFTAMERRFSFFENLLLVIIAGIFGLIGFITWDRYTTLRPLNQRFQRLEADLERDLELKLPEGSRLTRLIHALHELAKTDEHVAKVLRKFSLL